MGLDTVEILMEIEERFDVSIPDEVAGGIETVGQMRDEVVRLLVAAYERERKDRHDPLSRHHCSESCLSFSFIRHHGACPRGAMIDC